MARIVLGMGVSHGPLLGAPPEIWTTSFRKGDMANPLLWFRGKRHSYDELVALREAEGLEDYCSAEETTRRHKACRAAFDQFVSVFREVAPDILVIIGNDHGEVFTDVTPAFGVYNAPEHLNGPIHDLEVFIPGGFSPDGMYTPDAPLIHPGVPDMADHVIEALKTDGFDVAVISQTPVQGDHGQRVMAHGFGFVYHHMLGDAPPPSLPIHINTFFAPNQPSMARVIEFGEALVRAIEGWDTDKTVAIIGSGGLSHFIVDEELDRQLIAALRDDLPALTNIDESNYQSGTSEVKTWVPVAVAMNHSRTPMTLIDYVPCYRSPAGNGHGMTFAYWRPDS